MKSSSNLFQRTSSAMKMGPLEKMLFKGNGGDARPSSRLSLEDKKLVEEVKAQGDKITEKDVIFILKDRNGKIVWLEKGHLASKDKRASGLAHIKDEHASNFNDKGIPTHLIAKTIKKAIDESRIIGRGGIDTDVYETFINGKIVYIAITISGNGYIVGAHPAKKWKEKK